MALSSKRTWVVRGLAGLVAVYVLYLLAVGLFTTVAGQSYKAPAEAPADDRAKAACIAEALVQPLEEELDGAFGWLPNDILLVPRIIDNKTSFQLGEDSWGWWFLYNSEKRYREGIADWRLWASRVTGEQTKQAQVYNVTTSDIVEIMNWAIKTMEYTLGVLNDDKVGHFYGDNVIYYVKGISRVVDNIIEGLLQCDSSIIERGGKENVDELLKRLHMISQFNPIYVVGGSYGVGDSFWPNHIAAMARHIDVVSNRLTDIRNAMEK